MDNIIRGQLINYPVRFFSAVTSNSIEELRKIHNTTPTATAAAGRLLTAGMIMGSMNKGQNDKLTLIVSGNGPIEKITVTADNYGRAKCDIANPQINVLINSCGKLDVAKAVGEGKLTVIKDLGLKTPYNSTIELISSEIAEDIAYYYAASEQIPTVCALGVLVGVDGSVICAGGFIIQVMPNCPDKVITYLEKITKEIASVTDMLKNNYNEKDIIDAIFKKGSYDYKIEQSIKAKYYCDCNMEKAERILISLGKKELENIIRQDEGIELNCHFCKKKYAFKKEDIRRLIN